MTDLGTAAQSISAVTETINDISNGSQNVAANAQELKAMAARLNDIVGKFKF